ncbi:hypothetical protein RMQ97_11930 [Maricaulis sp. D1M11]|uniref:hypothetical protein n=1 Tax=Maricaulis sp. D1M11 TaxID=3076117 RepID=UPI0039B61615
MSQSPHRNLAHILKSGSTARILNLHRVALQYGDTDEHGAQPIFHNKRLNEAIILKHTLRPHERERVSADRINATKVIFPLSNDDLRLGGYSLFVEQANLQDALHEAIGKDTNPEKLAADQDILEEMARLPSLDPYLLNERLQQMGRKAARCYFDITEADMERVQTYVVGEIRRLVELAYQIEGAEAKIISTKLAKLIMRDEASKTLDPLRETLRLSREDYVQGMFAWKGFLYYKWNFKNIRPSFEPVAKDILSLRLIRAHSDDETYLSQVGKDIVRSLYEKIGQVDTNLQAYDKAFSRLVNENDASAFRGFLLNAPQMFITAGENLGAINHISSFWRFRFPPGQPRRAEVDDAYDIFRDFMSSLGADDQRMAA